jgi:hypothetical protein
MARVWRNCFAIVVIAACASNTPASTCFDDETLQNLAVRSANDTGTLVYVWSPRMVLSVSQARYAAHAAGQQGLDFLAVHDASVPVAEIQAALRRASARGASSARAARHLRASQALCAPQLIQRDALRHFPTAFVLSASGTHRFPIVGAMPPKFWQRSIAQRLASKDAP